ncbi:MAG TPA: acyl-CoA carboxylase subunit epsilon [Streptosporangiaceae bacterium]|nr:acyl-CoA carboxylase subunit epsilon [Streptosporangiaceae bacterium]
MTAPAEPQPGRSGETGPAPEPAPVLTIVRGNPSAEEIGAVVAVLAAAMASANETRARDAIRSQWSARSRLLRAPLPRSQGGWRASALPR